MSNIQLKFEAWMEDVNKEDSHTLRLFEKIINTLFSLIKWAGIPFVFYLLFELARW
ncbi:hypothetical protein [Neobacillus soli]|uniref:hypothetical protein n=1 Tax=Neobacillus soli TaxID=220688 RepID=UPI000B289121|nr:hypothetical protein [Neobacillus soli]